MANYMQGSGLACVTVSDHLKLLCDPSKKLIVNHYLLVRAGCLLGMNRPKCCIFFGAVGGGLAVRIASQVAVRGLWLGEAPLFPGRYSSQIFHN